MTPWKVLILSPDNTVWSLVLLYAYHQYSVFGRIVKHQYIYICVCWSIKKTPQILRLWYSLGWTHQLLFLQEDCHWHMNTMNLVLFLLVYCSKMFSRILMSSQAWFRKLLCMWSLHATFWPVLICCAIVQCNSRCLFTCHHKCSGMQLIILKFMHQKSHDFSTLTP